MTAGDAMRRRPAGPGSISPALVEKVERFLLARYAPPCLILRGGREIALALGAVSRYMKDPARALPALIEEVLPRDLAQAVDALHDRMTKDPGKPVHGSAFVGTAGERRSIDIVLLKLGGPASDLHLLVFEDPACLEGPGDDFVDDLQSIDPDPEEKAGPLPRRPPAPTARTRVPAGPPVASSSSGGGARCVLVIDDHVDHAERMRLLLELRGFRVAVAHDVAGGIEKARQFLPFLVLCSAALNGALGEESPARALKKEPGLASSFFVALTAAGQEKESGEVRSAGYHMHLQKPVDPVALIKLIETMPRPI